MGCLIENDRIIVNRYTGSVREKERQLSGSLHRSLLSPFKESRLGLYAVTEMSDLKYNSILKKYKY